VATIDTERLSAEYRALQEGCGLVDRSERGKLALTGSEAIQFLNGQITNELATLLPGEGRYAAFLTHKGKMLGDLRVLAVGEPGDPNKQSQPEGDDASTPLLDTHDVSTLLLDTERVALQPLFDMIRRFKVGYDVELHKRTLETALISLVGPSSREVVAHALDSHAFDGHASDGHAPDKREPLELSEVEHAHVNTAIADREVRLVSTDEGGVDVLCAVNDLDAVRSRLLGAGAVVVSEAAAEVVRVERGRPRYGLDLDETTIPQEAALNERAVSFTKGCYVGQETVARLYYKGKPNRHLRGLRLSQPAHAGQELYLGKRVVGQVASAVISPEQGPIGLALVRREAEPGVTVTISEGETTAEIVTLPFVA
jgi:folate-binding protein YgfZ